MFDLKNYRDLRYHNFHIYDPAKPHNFSLDFSQFAGYRGSFLVEDYLMYNADLIHKNLSKWYYSFYISIFYLLVIYFMKLFMNNRRPLQMKPVLIGWNILLAIFSIFGSFRCIPEFTSVLINHGLQHSYCQSTYYFVSTFFQFLFTFSIHSPAQPPTIFIQI